MRNSLQFSIGLAFALALGGAFAGCGDDDDTTDNSQTGSDASVSESGSGGRTSTAGRSGSGGSRATAGRSGSAGASVVAGTGAAAGTGAGAGGAAGRTNAGGSSAGVGGAASGGTGGATAGKRWSDGQIAAVTTAANTAEIQLGTLALGRTRKPEVRFFAQEMIQMHGAAQDRSSQLLQTLNLVPIQNELSTQLEKDAQRVATTLQSTPDASFDVAYVQSQVEIHVQVLKLFDEQLLPNITEIALRTDLTLARGDVQRHLSEAQALLVLVQSAPLDLDAGTEDAGN